MSQSRSNLTVIFPFLAEFTTLRALFIIPIPKFESSVEESVNSLGFAFDLVLVFVFMIVLGLIFDIRPA